MNILIIGIGYHARRIYIPFFMKEPAFGAKIVCGLDISSQKNVIETYLSKNDYSLDVFYTDARQGDVIEADLDILLKKIVKKYSVDSVIISTEPLCHFKYARWALENNLNILMDKPITTEYGVSVEKEKARKLISDFNFLKNLYISKKNEGLISTFSLMAQRRFHPPLSSDER
jgi:predicted dehydrogenase